jgi:YHS domain-containing protein
MSRLFLFLVLVLALYGTLHLLIKDMPSRKRTLRKERDLEELVQDPCCQIYIPKQSAIRRSVSGRDCYFCSETCLKSYLEKKD